MSVNSGQYDIIQDLEKVGKDESVPAYARIIAKAAAEDIREMRIEKRKVTDFFSELKNQVEHAVHP
jgi:hypothetical protein